METTPPSPTLEGASLEKALMETMDRQMIRFIEILGNDEIRDDGNPVYDLRMRLEVFKQAENWMAKRKKFAPEAEDTEAGIKAMQELLRDPEKLGQKLEEMGFARIPPKRMGRPTKVEQAQKAKVKAAIHASKNGPVDSDADDGALQAALRTGAR